MLAVHWTPVNNTKSILKNGIRKSKTGLYCFPLTGIKQLDKWWVNFFNQSRVRARKKYNGIVFRITQDDLPASFRHWVGDRNLNITDLKTLEAEYRQTVLWRIGEQIAADKSLEDWKHHEKFMPLAEAALKDDPGILQEHMRSFGFMGFTFEDYEIILSSAIPANRIIKVIPQGNEFGRVLKQQKKFGPIKHRKAFYQSEE
ncbi:hypothetical protein L3C95_09280 [Chitinophaga filiformis]|uniref:hypothetical protein n=1 Tax=Chitinophaga filiformis TaxID=104663 RepID=UPI001F39D01D|nr:hypothetical protein [Chitinophaga filiformis]MCF6403064.1 hypothetical protein [Chitinophaga filiformis]